ncbi:MAG: efflux RND transporter permease subunit [Deltaproteobacteria bacterium]|nr:efflux RND transporter permease subunit [Deltaproteobacteria bacterium]
MDTVPRGTLISMVHKFLTTHLSVIFIILAVCLGFFSVYMTPREEEPQIVVPMVDILVSCPGSDSEEIERIVTTPLERFLWQIDGVEHVYSISDQDKAVVTVRFYVGQDRERSYVKVNNKIEANKDKIPSIVSSWIVRPVEIDDVPIVTVAVTSSKHSMDEIRRVSEEMKARLDSVRDISLSGLIGSSAQRVRVIVDTKKMESKNITFLELADVIRNSNFAVTAGSIVHESKNIEIIGGPFLTGIDDLENLSIKSVLGKNVYLKDIAVVEMNTSEPQNYVFFGVGPGNSKIKNYIPGQSQHAVTLTFSKKKGTNAVGVAKELINEVKKLEKEIFPHGMHAVITRNNGQTADDKVNELLSSLVFAVITVVALIAIIMGWREALVVALAVPISFALALFVNYITGYTINRVTLFALILSLGLVVDDPITNVDNIQRHIFQRKKNPLDATLDAVKEVLPPVIMSTLTIIVSFIPMFFITGMMGPYMKPMAINVPLTVAFSTLCALTFVPWLAYKLLKDVNKDDKNEDVTPSWVREYYRKVLSPLLNKDYLKFSFFGVIFALFIFAGWLAYSRRVPLKMLPFDNKNEFQVLLDMPEGTALEDTLKGLRKIEKLIASIPEVTDYSIYAGIPSPLDFNGLVRHYNFRTLSNQGEIRVNLAHKHKRSMQSHGLILSLRGKFENLGNSIGGKVKIIELPPGPPVISTITAEVYGSSDMKYSHIISESQKLMKLLSMERGVTEIDTMAESPHFELKYNFDRESAIRNGIFQRAAVQTLMTALGNVPLGAIHFEHEREARVIYLEASPEVRKNLFSLSELRVKGVWGDVIDLGTLGSFDMQVKKQPIYHKNLKRLVYITAETAGRAPAEVIFDTQKRVKKSDIDPKIKIEWAGEGEWQITLRVFRDLGLAFGAALIGIYLLLIIETNSFFMPLIIMSAIPLTAIGIMPGFWILNFFSDTPGGIENPIFFTATAMIGMIALGGIVVRNSIVLIEFIQDSVKSGMDLKESILESGAVRFRPIILTAGTTALGAWPITLDPIFSGLAWSLIFGLIASTCFTLLVVPVIYYMIAKK